MNDAQLLDPQTEEGAISFARGFVRSDAFMLLFREGMGLVEQTLRNWVKAFDAGTLNAVGAPKVTAEAMELSRLRAENVRLKREVEILKKREFCLKSI